MMRRHVSKQKQIPISEKVKRMFRYSPSYEAQKCYAKLPLRYSYASTNATRLNSAKQNEINCEYSSVKQKNIETNECNDTSSWIAKLVSGIQDQDDQNRIFHRLSQIDKNSVGDLPEDSQDYEQNQFLLQQGDSLFYSNKLKQDFPNKTSTFHKQMPITNPIKKSIKDALIQIELKQNKEGLTVPPVTRANSSSKRQNQKPSKMSNSEKNPKHQKLNFIEENTKSQSYKASQHKVKKLKSQRNSNLIKNTKSEQKRKTKTLQKLTQKSIQVDNLNITYKNQSENYDSAKFLDHDLSLEVSTCKNSFIHSGTKKQSIHKLRNQNQDIQTRKNSFITKDQLSECKEQHKIVEEHSKYLNMKNLFSQGNQIQVKPQSHHKILSTANAQANKRVGSIKKNVVRNSTKLNRNEIFGEEIASKQRSSKEILNYGEKIKYTENKSLQLLKQSYLQPKRQSKDHILIDLDCNSFPSSFRNCNTVSSPKRDIKSLQQQNKPYIEVNRQTKTLVNSIIPKRIENQNIERILCLFNRIKLDPNREIIEKSNLRIRGLTEEQKAELGSIITKIHYQNAKFDFESFLKEFKKVNAQCTLSGCLSQQKLRKHKNESPIKQCVPLKAYVKENSIKNGQIVDPNISFQKDEQVELIQPNGIGHLRRNSRIIKKKLFEEIKRISYLQEVTVNQLEKNSRITQKSQTQQKGAQQNDQSMQNSSQKAVFQNSSNLEYPSKDPYVQAPSMCDISLSKRDIVTHRGFLQPIQQQSPRIPQNYKKFSIPLIDAKDTCLIERLNQKLSSYIDKNQIQNTFRQFNLNFSQLKKHIR